MFPSHMFPPSCRTTKLFITVLAGMRLLFCVLTIHMVLKVGWCDGCKVTLFTLVRFLSTMLKQVILHIPCNCGCIPTVLTYGRHFPLVFGPLILANIFLFFVNFHRFTVFFTFFTGLFFFQYLLITIGSKFPWSLVIGINCFVLFKLLLRTLIFYENLLTLLCKLFIIC